MMYLALETNQWVAILVGVACLGLLVVIVVTPWRRIRSEARQLAGVPVIRQHGDGARLCQRLELEDAGKDRVPGEVTGKEGLVAGDAVPTLNGDAGLEGVHGGDEAERRPVREQGDERVGIDPHWLR